MLLLLVLCSIAGLSRAASQNSPFPRFVCVKQDAPAGCSENFTEKYPELTRNGTADTFFILYSKNSPDKPENLNRCGGSLPKKTIFSKFDRLFVILPSFIFSYCKTAVFREMKVQFMNTTPFIPNVMAVDYGWANPMDISTFQANVQLIAKQVVKVLENIKKNPVGRFSSIYLIGFGTGAHIAGLVGKKIKVQRITALDPFGPTFQEDTPAENRLAKGDANLIDVWHTNMGPCMPNLGINYDPGNVIFYFNGGTRQPACPTYALNSILKGDINFGIVALLYPQFCSHMIAAQYYKVSINSNCCEFLAYECASVGACKTGKPKACQGAQGSTPPTCTIAGYNTDRDKHITDLPKEDTKKFYVNTTSDCPYCIEPTQNQLDGYASNYKYILKYKSEQNCTFNF